MAMRLLTAVEVAAGAAERWRKQYADWSPEDTFADGTTLRSHNDALNSHQHTPENITRILNKGWAYPRCDSCGKHVDQVVVFKEDWSDDGASICDACLRKASLIAGIGRISRRC